MSKKLMVIPAKPGQTAAPKSEFVYPLTLHRPPQYPGAAWQEKTYNTPAELLAAIAKMHDEYLSRWG